MRENGRWAFRNWIVASTMSGGVDTGEVVAVG